MQLDKDKMIEELAQFQRAMITREEINEIFTRHLLAQGYDEEQIWQNDQKE